MREKLIEQTLYSGVKLHGGIAIKLSSMFFAGLPDRLVLMPKGRVYFVETKAPGRQPSKIQRAVHRMLNKLGFTVYIIDSIEDVRAFIDLITTE